MTKYIAQFGCSVLVGIALAPIVALFFPTGEPTQEAVKPAPANPAFNDAVLVENPQ